MPPAAHAQFHSVLWSKSSTMFAVGSPAIIAAGYIPPSCLLLPARRCPSSAKLSAPSTPTLRVLLHRWGRGRLRRLHPQCTSRQSSTSSPLSTHMYRTARDEAELVVAASAQHTAYYPFLDPSMYQKPLDFDAPSTCRNLTPWLSVATFRLSSANQLIPDGCKLVRGCSTSGEATSAFASKLQETMTKNS